MSWHVLPGERAAYTLVQVPPALLDGIPHKRGEQAVVVRHDYRSWHLLRSRGAVLPSPLAHYNWPGRWTPRANQKITAEFFVNHARAICTSGMRVGKTMSSLWAADYLMTDGACRRVLIIARKSTHINTWERAVVQHLMHRGITRLTGTAARKRQMAMDTSQRMLLVTPQSLHLIADHLPEVDLIIADEATAFKEPRTRQWKALNRALNNTGARLWMMTASPTAQGPMDAYGMAKLLSSQHITAGTWRDMTMRKVSQFRWVPRPEANEVVLRHLQPNIRFSLADCGDVPEVQYEYLPVELSDEQTTVLTKLQEQAIAQFPDDGVQVVADNAGALSTKVLQVLSGGVYAQTTNKERVVKRIDAEPFFDAIRDYVAEADTPVLIFASFRPAAQAIHDALAESGARVALINGDTKDDDRNRYFDQVQARELDALVAVAGTMSYGITLDASSYVLWTSPAPGNEVYTQSNGRVLQADSNKRIMISHLVTNKRVETLFKRQKENLSTQDVLLDLMKHPL